MNGNITHLTRTGMMQAGSYGVIDDLSMTYVGNQLSAATDAAAAVLREGSLDFKGSGSCAYVYNGNGALVSDQSRGIAKIDYDTNNTVINGEFVYWVFRPSKYFYFPIENLVISLKKAK